MQRYKNVGFFLVFSLLCGCGSQKKAAQTTQEVVISDTVVRSETEVVSKKDNPLEMLLKANPAYFADIIAKRDSLNVQIIYTQINRQANNNPVFKNYYYNYHPRQYRYPASTVKLPVALLALQRLNELKIAGLDKQSGMITEAAYSGQTAVYNDPTTPDGIPTIEQYVKKIFLVSDNDAFNRLYEFLGQEYINENLHKMGYRNLDILHHLDISLTEDENRHTNPIRFIGKDSGTVYEQAMQYNQQPYPDREDFVGKAYYKGNQLIEEPLNFSKKNRLLLEDLNNILKSVLFPSSVPAKQRFNLTPEDYKLVWQYMSQFPPETKYPPYDSSEYYDAYAKLLLYGSQRGSVPKHIRIFSKEGDAYGFLTDVAYIVDFDKKIEFMLTATIYCNSDGILNDEKYDYDTVGYPFMKHLGEVIYEYELKRERQYQPDLSNFLMKYDKQ